MADLKISALTASTTPLAGTEVLPIVQSGTTKQVSVANLTAGRTVAMQSTVLGGITMPAWASPFDSVMQMKYGAITGSGTSDSRWFMNSYYDGAYKYVANGYASRYDQSSGQHFWYTAANNAGGAGAACSFTQVAQLGTTGDFTLNTGNLVIGTSGKGIDFSATSGSGTSELLADYEEGTFTPSLVPSTSGSITLTTAAAKYTKVGRAVTVTGICEVASVSSPVGTLQLQGLPFANSADASSRSSAAIYATSLAATATTSIMARIIPSESQIRIEKFTAGSTSAMAGDVQTNTIIQFNLTYFV